MNNARTEKQRKERKKKWYLKKWGQEGKQDRRGKNN